MLFPTRTLSNVFGIVVLTIIIIVIGIFVIIVIGIFGIIVISSYHHRPSPVQAELISFSLM
jgi:hypothetical protein